MPRQNTLITSVVAVSLVLLAICIMAGTAVAIEAATDEGLTLSEKEILNKRFDKEGAFPILMELLDEQKRCSSRMKRFETHMNRLETRIQDLQTALDAQTREVKTEISNAMASQAQLNVTINEYMNRLTDKVTAMEGRLNATGDGLVKQKESAKDAEAQLGKVVGDLSATRGDMADTDKVVNQLKGEIYGSESRMGLRWQVGWISAAVSAVISAAFALAVGGVASWWRRRSQPAKNAAPPGGTASKN